MLNNIIESLHIKWENFMNGKTLRSRVAKGVIWSGIGGGSERMLRLLRNIIF